MLTNEKKQELTELVNEKLDWAEEVWNTVGEELTIKVELAESMSKRAEIVPSRIPGHEQVSDEDPRVDQFIALVADMRDSSDHLLQRISERITKVSQLQRVFYETTALLPALDLTIKYEEGEVTEYLGDGVLALFLVKKNNETEAIYDALHAAQHCIDETRQIVNSALRKRYGLPDLNIGVGMACSKAIICAVGLRGKKHAKAIGECVWRATKLSGGTNQIYVDDWLKEMWPTSKDGKMKFLSKVFGGKVSGYLLNQTG